MKVEFEIDNNIDETKVVIYSKEKNEEIKSLMSKLENYNYNFENLIGTKDDMTYILEQENIESFLTESGRVYARIGNTKFNIKRKLYELEENFKSTSFVRISNSEIVNFNKVESLDIQGSLSIRLNFKSGEYTYVSRRYIKRIKNFLKIYEEGIYMRKNSFLFNFLFGGCLMLSSTVFATILATIYLGGNLETEIVYSGSEYIYTFLVGGAIFTIMRYLFETLSSKIDKIKTIKFLLFFNAIITIMAVIGFIIQIIKTETLGIVFIGTLLGVLLIWDLGLILARKVLKKDIEAINKKLKEKQ